jgi:hypothetical protein
MKIGGILPNHKTNSRETKHAFSLPEQSLVFTTLCNEEKNKIFAGRKPSKLFEIEIKL